MSKGTMDLIMSLMTNLFLVIFLFAIVKKEISQGLVYGLCFILSMISFLGVAYYRTSANFLNDYFFSLLIGGIFFALIWGSICYGICGLLFKSKFGEKSEV